MSILRSGFSTESWAHCSQQLMHILMEQLRQSKSDIKFRQETRGSYQQATTLALYSSPQFSRITQEKVIDRGGSDLDCLQSLLFVC